MIVKLDEDRDTALEFEVKPDGFEAPHNDMLWVRLDTKAVHLSPHEARVLIRLLEVELQRVVEPKK